MTKEQLPELFSNYWQIKKELPLVNSAPLKQEQLSKEWIAFLDAIKRRVEKDLTKEK